MTELATFEKKPSFAKGYGYDEASTEIAKEDIKLPQVKLMQDYDEERGIPGDFIDSVSLKNYGTALDIVVLKHEKEWLRFAEDFKLETRSKDGKFWDNGQKLTEEEEWKFKSEKFFVLIPSDLGPIPKWISFMKTSHKSGLELLNFTHALSKAINEAIYLRLYTLFSEKVTGGKTGDYHVLKVKPKGYVQDKQVLDTAKIATESIRFAETRTATSQPDETLD